MQKTITNVPVDSAVEVEVRLIGAKDDLHAVGRMAFSVLSPAVSLERDHKYYRFYGFSDGVVIFTQCVKPIVITEF